MEKILQQQVLTREKNLCACIVGSKLVMVLKACSQVPATAFECKLTTNMDAAPSVVRPSFTCCPYWPHTTLAALVSEHVTNSFWKVADNNCLECDRNLKRSRKNVSDIYELPVLRSFAPTGGCQWGVKTALSFPFMGYCHLILCKPQSRGFDCTLTCVRVAIT